MTQINCHIPIKLRLVGQPDDAQLEQLGQTIVRSVRQRIAFAERTIAARYHLAALDCEIELREPYDPAREAAAAAAYQIPAYDQHGQPTTVALQQHRRPWIIRRAINFRAYVGQFLGLMDSWGVQTQDTSVYFDLFQEQRWMSLWLVQVNQSMLRSQLMHELATRVHQLNRASKQTEYYAISGDESFRQQLIELDQDDLIAREIPSLPRRTGTLEPGGDLQLPAGSRVLFASMALPIIELRDRADAAAGLQVTVRLRDLTFIVNPVGFDRFERRFGLPWADYLREFGDRPALIQIQLLTVRKPTHIIALTALVEQTAGQQPAAGPETVLFSRLDVLTSTKLNQWPPVVRGIGNQYSDDTTRALNETQTAAELAPNWKAAYLTAALAISLKSIELARYRPQAGALADAIIPLISDRLVTAAEQGAFRRFIKNNYSSLFPTPFEVLLDELKRREQGRWFDRLFAAAQEVQDYDTRLLIISMAKQTPYADDPQVRALLDHHNQVNRRHSTGNVYNVATQQIILNKLFGDEIVPVNAILYDIYSTYIHEEKRYKPKPLFAPIWEAALLREAFELIGRIEKGEDSQGLGSGYTDIEFAEAVLKAVLSRIKITEDNYGDYFDTVTIQLSVRFLGLKKYTDELGIETITVFYRVVEREKGGSWQDIGDVSEAGDADFDYMIDRWVHEHVSSAIITMAHIALAIAAIGVAWEFGVIQVFTRVAGGARIVIPSVLLSAIYESVIHGFTFENFVIGAINGYLGALFFRGASLLARGLFGSSISTVTFRNDLLRWVGVQIFKGSVGGGATGAAMVFTHDVYMVATGRGSWSSPEVYAKSIGWGAALGVGMEFAGPLILEPVLGKLVGGAVDVARVLRANGISPARWQVWSAQALKKMTQSLDALLETNPLRAANLRDGFRLLYEQIGEAYAGLGGALRGRVQLAVFRQIIEFSGAEFSGAAGKGLEKFLTVAASTLDDDAAAAMVKRILAPGGGANDFFEALNLLDEHTIETLARTNQLAQLVTTDLRMARALYPTWKLGLIQIAAKLRAQNQAGQLQLIEELAQQQRIVGFGDWVAESASREAARMMDKVMELAGARHVLQEHLYDPATIVRIGQDAHTAGRSFDITVERRLPGGGTQVLSHTEVSMPEAGIQRGRQFIAGIAHAAKKIPKGVRDGSVALPVGSQEGTIAVQWPPTTVHVGGDAEIAFDAAGGYQRRSVADPTVTRGNKGNLLDDAVHELNRTRYDNPFEFVQRLTVIDQNGRVLFKLINTTPGVRPMKWIWQSW